MKEGNGEENENGIKKFEQCAKLYMGINNCIPVGRGRCKIDDHTW